MNYDIASLNGEHIRVLIPDGLTEEQRFSFGMWGGTVRWQHTELFFVSSDTKTAPTSEQIHNKLESLESTRAMIACGRAKKGNRITVILIRNIGDWNYFQAKFTLRTVSIVRSENIWLYFPLAARKKQKAKV